MRKPILAAMLAISAAAPMMTTPAMAQYRDRGRDYGWHGDNNPQWDPRSNYRPGGRERRLGRDDRIYRGSDNRYYCRRNDGTTGLVIGAVGGAVLGGAVGGNTLGALLGGAGGALLGRSIDRGKVRCR